MLKDLVFYKEISTGNFGLELAPTVRGGALVPYTGPVTPVTPEMKESPSFRSTRPTTPHRPFRGTPYSVGVSTPGARGPGLAPFVVATELLSMFGSALPDWATYTTTGNIGTVWGKCAMPDCPPYGSTVVYADIPGCPASGQCANWGATAPTGSSTPIQGPQLAIEFRGPEIFSYWGTRHAFYGGSGTPEPVRFSGTATLPVSMVQGGETLSSRSLHTSSRSPSPDPQEGMFRDAVTIGVDGAAPLELVSRGEYVEIVQPSSGSGKGGFRGLPPSWMLEGFPEDVAKNINQRVDEKIKAYRKKHKLGPDYKKKTWIKKTVARAIKLYHTATEVSDAIENVYAALPKDVQKACGSKTPAQMMMCVQSNWASVNMPLALTNLVYNHYEDKIVGRSIGKLGRTGFRTTNLAFTRVLGQRQNQVGNEIQAQMREAGIPKFSPFGGYTTGIRKAAPGATLGAAVERMRDF